MSLTAFASIVSTASAEADRNATIAKINLHNARIALLAEKYHDSPEYYAARQKEQANLNHAIQALYTNDFQSDIPGIHLEAYQSDVDNSVQPFWTYVPAKKAQNPGLLVFLHGYSTALDLVSVPGFPQALADLAEQAGAFAVAPFARANTDYQHLGEVDVLRVIDEMSLRYGIDRDKIVLSGVSMGGLGCWCIGARNAHLFNAICVICGRGDFYVWHNLKPDEIPSWHREIIDTQFATKYLPNLIDTEIIAIHGRYDDVVTYEQGVFPVNQLIKLGSKKARLITVADGGHDIFGAALSCRDFTDTIVRGLSGKLPHRRSCNPSPAFRGEAGSKTMNALLKPFMLISCCDNLGNTYPPEQFYNRVKEWESFGQGIPRTKTELTMTRNDVTNCNLICFGEPEYSRLILALLKRASVKINSKSFTFAGKKFNRDAGHGFLIATKNPFNTNLTAIVQCGIPWALGQSPNHKFDRIPDVISYTDENDIFGYPVAEAAGFINDDGTVRWSPNPFTESIRKPEVNEETFSNF